MLLPIGTVVLLKEGKKRLMITGYLVTPNDDKSITYDYSACMYPEGIISSEQTLVFNHEEIESVFHKGFEDLEAQEFIKKLTEINK